eukprot:TRINITY_DN33468_c0_g1_i3.p2 TRINITY_DN33468_c0_g1~~TRINITY_DN33468_c0_g1_i3.p2  ORF type:complete len:196 (+),score=25.72 TRINITY_DN33468_c0_g1_i3:409-996(+)
MPPRPCPSRRVPRKTRGLSSPSSGCSGVSSSSSNSPVGPQEDMAMIDGSATARNEDARRDGGLLPSSSSASARWTTSTATTPAATTPTATTPAVDATPRTPTARTATPVVSARSSAPAPQASQGTLDYSDYCCYGRLRRSTFEAIPEGQPQVRFDRDVNVLDLVSILRRNSVDASDALVSDLLTWKARAAQPRTD